MTIQYVTRGNASPQGKSRLWFCRAAKDEAIFTSLCEDILSRQNCAVYYDKTPDEPYDPKELAALLSEMQLIVLPITTALLTGESRILETELSLAKEHHIPLLPILTEGGLAALFNQKIGELQYLDKTAEDETTLSYGEKLTAFLNETLFNDTLLQKIRAAFSDTLFLSYRKKDRRYLKRLMQAIHESELFADLAIWYDEYLIPGENFNDAIDSALAESRAMLLAVTPSLTEEGNYVKTVEYPRAKALGKPILPIELLPTDGEEMQKQYPDIPKIFPIVDKAAFSSALAELLGKQAAPRPLPAEDYLHALAFLGGIGVAIDPERALTLLYRSATSALPEAMEKIAAMYRYGNGVSRDLDAAETWYNRAACVRKLAMEEEQTEEALSAYCRTMEALGELSMERAKYDMMGDYYGRALDAAKKAGFEEGDEAHRAYIATLYEKIGLAGRKNTAFFYAKRQYEAALAIRKTLSPSPDNTAAIISLTYRLGDCCRLEDALDDAAMHYRNALSMIEAQALEDDPELLRLSAVMYEKIGDLAKASGEDDAAEEHYRQMKDAAARYAAVLRTPAAKRLLALSLERLGRMARENFNGEKAFEALTESAKLREEIDAEIHTYESRRDLCVINIGLGRLYQNYELYDKADALYHRAFHIGKELYDSTGAAEVLHDLAVIIERFAELASDREEFEEACSHFENAIRFYEAVTEEDRSIDALRSPAIAIDHYAELLFMMEKTDEATEQFERALALRKALYESHPTATVLQDIGASYAHLRDMAMLRFDFAAYAEYSSYAADPSEALENDSYSYSSRRSYASMYEEDGTDAFDRGDYEEAISCYLDALDNAPDDDVEHSVMRHMEEIAFRYTKKAQTEPSYWQNILKIWQSLAAYFENNVDYARFAEIAESMIKSE